MQFNTLGKKSSGTTKKKADLPFNLPVRLTKINLTTDKPSTFEGINVVTGEPVVVRMATVEEGVKINQRVKETYEEAKARITRSYVGAGEVHRPRPSEIANPDHKTHCQPGGLLMFTKCVKNDDGTIRAHWVDTLEKTPGAGCEQMMVNVRIEDRVDPKDRTKVLGTQVAVDVIRPEAAVMLDKNNVMPTLLSTLNNVAGEEKLKPFAYLRLIGQDGSIVLAPSRVNAAYIGLDTVDHDTGESYKVWEAASPMDSLKAIMSPENVSQDGLIVRAALHGFQEDGYPAFGDMDADTVEDLNKITDAVRTGLLSIEMIPGQRISAGPATRASIEKSVKTNPNNPLNSLYTKRDQTTGRTVDRLFAPTFVTTKLGKDGHRLFTKAIPVESYPKGISLMKLSTANDLQALAEAAQERAAEANATDVVVPDDDLPFDPTALDKDATSAIDNAMANSANALIADM